jgi:DNA processing protein
MHPESSEFLILASVEGLGCRGVHRLLEHYETPTNILRNSMGELVNFGLPELVAQMLLSSSRRIQAEIELDKCRHNQVALLTLFDSSYPKLLRQIYDPPTVLYVKGQIECLDLPSVAIVGSRRATPYGVNTAERLSRDLAARGLVICSGLARGIDTAAHRGALEAKGQTIAVLGSGLLHIYPRENKRLAQQIENQGCVISEFPLTTSPVPQNFPIRNRIISGLSLGTCLVEAAEFSGSLITGRMALEQGREVFAIPGNITSATSFGPNLWIKQGAKLVQDWQDIAEELPREIRAQMNLCSETHQAALFTEVLTEREKFVLELLRLDEAVHLDDLLEVSQLSSSELLSVLSELEFKEKLKQLPGKHFVKKF